MRELTMIRNKTKEAGRALMAESKAREEVL